MYTTHIQPKLGGFVKSNIRFYFGYQIDILNRKWTQIWSANTIHGIIQKLTFFSKIKNVIIYL